MRFVIIMTKIRKIFNTLYEIISTVIITVGIILAIVYLCGIRLYHVKSGSMRELLPVGSVCFVNTYSKYEDIKAGDVISFRVSNDMLVTHRAEKITDNGIITKGDSNITEDPDLVTKENYIGKTVFAIPYIGRIFGSLHTFKGLFMLGIIAVLLIISGIFYKKKEE
ncbi:signal peptidase, endoplasmic reticulum-type [Ruminococcus flavefaciens]|uniref:Signal peptidase I n=2 Tax=Ruminococcus flavefaciens TaxID=1265 RepID=A0A1M7LSH2_RUMFL|nr:signal peptidase, endoplasmic reticulum-type [Ruminococcus flavefaciens]